MSAANDVSTPRLASRQGRGSATYVQLHTSDHPGVVDTVLRKYLSGVEILDCVQDDDDWVIQLAVWMPLSQMRLILEGRFSEKTTTFSEVPAPITRPKKAFDLKSIPVPERDLVAPRSNRGKARGRTASRARTPKRISKKRARSVTAAATPVEDATGTQAETPVVVDADAVTDATVETVAATAGEATTASQGIEESAQPATPAVATVSAVEL
jgi:hypothetical protein